MDERNQGLDEEEHEASINDVVWSTDDDSCDHCSKDAVTRENGTLLCEDHLQEYEARFR